MRLVKIINGTYGYRPEGAKFVTPVKAGEHVVVSDEEAARLIALHVALADDELTSEMAAPPVATPHSGEDGGGGGKNPPAGENGAGSGAGGDTLDIVDGHFTVASLMELTRADMEKLAADLGVNVGKCRNKAEIADLLAAVEVEPGEPEGVEAPPELGAAPPVV